METFYQILALVGAGLIIWILYNQIKNRPDLFNRKSISKSFSSMGILGLVLIAFVTLLIFLVRAT